MLAALADGKTTLKHVLFSDDSQRMLDALQTLGFDLDINTQDRTVTITGLDGTFPPPPSATEPTELFLGNAGTATRFLTAAVCLAQPGSQYIITGIPRMLERPIGELVAPLRQLGADITNLGEEGFPPLLIKGIGQLPGGIISMKPTLSSQFITALLQIGPLCKNGITLNFDGPITSLPYVKMTLDLMAIFGAEIEHDPNWQTITVKPASYKPTNWLVEPDASNASYALAMAAVLPHATTEIKGLNTNSMQGDAAFAHQLAKMGAKVQYLENSIIVTGTDQLTGIDEDFNDIPDMVQTIAVVALFANGLTRIRNVGNLRVKETDRMEALHIELSKLGATVTIAGDDLIIEPPADNILINHTVPKDHPNFGKPLTEQNTVVIDTYDDHRMAMSFAIAGIKHPGIIIDDPACVNKTFPSFFDELETLRKAQRQTRV